MVWIIKEHLESSINNTVHSRSRTWKCVLKYYGDIHSMVNELRIKFKTRYNLILNNFISKHAIKFNKKIFNKIFEIYRYA